MTFEDHFSDRAAAYAAHRPTYPMELVDRLSELAGSRKLAWDVGCGSGQLSLRLAERFEHVIATDASAEQIAGAARHPRIEYRRAPAEASELPPKIADLVTVAQAAHWFDLSRFYAEARRVGRAGAPIALVSYGNVRVDGAIDPLIRDFHDNVAGPYWPPGRQHVEDGYRSLPFPFEEVAVTGLEIRTRWGLADFLGYVNTWSAVRALEKTGGRAGIDAFEEDLARVWGTEVRSVHWPLALRVGRL